MDETIKVGPQSPRARLLDRRFTMNLDHWVTVAIVAAMAWNVMAPTIAPAFTVLSIGPIQLYTFDVLILLTAALAAPLVASELRRTQLTIQRAIVVAVVLYLAYQLVVIFPLALIKTNDSVVSVLRTLAVRFSLVYVLYFYLRGVRAVGTRFIIRTVNVAAVCLAVFAAARYAIEGPIGYTLAGEDRLRQVEGGAAMFFGWLIISRLILYRASAFNAGLILIGGMGIVLVNYRMAYLGLAFALLLVLVSSQGGLRRLPIAIWLTGLAVLLMFFAPSTVKESALYSITRVIDPSTPTATNRLEKYRMGLEYFRAHPFGDFAISGRYYLPKYDATPGLTYPPHNFVVQILALEGLPAFIFFAFLIGATCVVGWRNRRRDPTSAVMLGFFVYYLVFCSFTTHFYEVSNAGLFGVTVAAILWRDSNRSRELERGSSGLVLHADTDQT